MNYQYAISNETIAVTFEDGTTKSLKRSHSHSGELIEALHDEVEDTQIRLLFSMAEGIKRYMFGNVQINEDGVITYKGKEIATSVTNKILECMRLQLPYEPWVAFLNDLLQNPSNKAQEDLFNFMRNEDLKIDSNGKVVAYKAVTWDYRDKWTKKLDNSVGTRVTMPRNEVCDRSEVGCASGLHMGSIQYVRGYANQAANDRIILVSVWPHDVVSVPSDSQYQKMRVCHYEVLADVTEEINPDVATSPLYTGQDDDGSGTDITFNGVTVNVPDGFNAVIKPNPDTGKLQVYVE